MSNEEIVYRICLLGDRGVGKHNFLGRLLRDEYCSESNQIIQVSFGSRAITISDCDSDRDSKCHSNRSIRGQFWEIEQPPSRAIPSAYYRGAYGAFVVYDISDRETFRHIESDWLPELRNNASECIRICIVGNKSDLALERQVSSEE